MKFWVYSIDWRSMAIEIICEKPTESQADIAIGQHVAGLSKEELSDFVRYKTINHNQVTDDMQQAVEQFKRFNGRVA